MKDCADILFPYAYDENGTLTHISSVCHNDASAHTFTCPLCAQPMIAKLCELNAHHFAHAGGKSCSTESYLHRLAKDILLRRFNSSQTFEITFCRIMVCENAGHCRQFSREQCFMPDIQSYDLKQHYDLPAALEYAYCLNGITYRPDILLTSSDNRRKPIFLEIHCCHKADKEKRMSGIPIIEFQVKTMADLPELQTCPIKETEKISFINFKTGRMSINNIFSQYGKRQTWGKNGLCPIRLTSRRAEDSGEEEIRIIEKYLNGTEYLTLGIDEATESTGKLCNYCKHYHSNKGTGRWCLKTSTDFPDNSPVLDNARTCRLYDPKARVNFIKLTDAKKSLGFPRIYRMRNDWTPE